MKNGGTAVNSDFKEHNAKNLLRKALLKISNKMQIFQDYFDKI